MSKMSFRRWLLAAACAALAAFPFSAAAQPWQAAASGLAALEEGGAPLPPGVQVVSLSGGSAVFELQAPAFHLEQPQTSGARPCQEIAAEGYAQNGAPGEPALVSAGFMLGIAADAEPVFRVLSAEFAELPGKHRLCPIRGLAFEPDANGDPQYLGQTAAEDAQLYAQDAFFPAQVVELSPAGMIRSQRVAELRFAPFQYNPASETLRAVRRMRVEVQLAGAGDARKLLPPQDEGLFEPLLRQALVNYEQARPWRAPAAAAPQGFSPSAALLDGESYKILVNQDGIIQVTYAALQAAGVPVDALDPTTLRLLHRGVEVPMAVFGEADGRFDPSDYLLFYGQKNNTKFTDANVYWLGWGNGPGLRVQTASGAVTGGAAVPDSFKTTLHLEQNTTYRNGYPSGPENDHWYWTLLNGYSAPVTQNFTFQLANLASCASPAAFRGLLKGLYAAPEHHTRISLNGTLLEDARWPSTAEHAFSFEISQSALVQGTNTITIEVPRDGGITADQVLVNWFEFDYCRGFAAENNLLALGNDAPGWYEFRVGGFASSDIAVWDVTDPLAPVLVTGGSVTQIGAAYQVSFEQQASGARRYLALTPPRWLAPAAVAADAPSTLRDPANGADIIIIGYGAFLPAVQPLASYRAGQGYRVRVVDVQDVYDEFNGGIFDPQAIQSFLAYAYASWTPPRPAFVLLVGDGHYDFKEFLSGSGPNYIPPFLGEFDPWIGETASENRYVMVSGGDRLPDMHIGRLPANSEAETAAMVAKILAYEQSPIQGDWNSQLTFVADNAEAGDDFPALSDKIADHALRPEFSAEKVYLGSAAYPNASAVTAAITNAVNQGRLVVHYTGHASIQYWAAERLFQVSSIASLANGGRYPFFVSMTCADGYFIHSKAPGRNLPSLAESLLAASGKGSVANFAPTGFGLPNGHDLLAQGLYQAIFSNGITQLGAAATYAKAYLNANSSGYADLLDTFMLFGDPATRLKSNPTAVTLASFSGVPAPGGVRLEWEIANEVSMLGYNLYRAESLAGPRQKVNAALVPAVHAGEMLGAAYQYLDLVPPGVTVYYWLELEYTAGADLTDPIQVATRHWLRLPAVFR